MTQLMTLPEAWEGMPATFIEGALLAANANPKPLAPEIWLPVLITGGVDEDEAVALQQDDKMAVLNTLSCSTAISRPVNLNCRRN